MGYTKSQSSIPFGKCFFHKFGFFFAKSFVTCTTESSWIQNVHMNLSSIEEIASKLSSSQGKVSGWNEIQWALMALRLTDLTTLAGDDSASNVERLCLQGKMFSMTRSGQHNFWISSSSRLSILNETHAIF